MSNYVFSKNPILHLVLFVVFVLNNSASALPFNTDMISSQPATGRIMRPAPKDSIEEGAAKRFVGTKEESASLQNPVPATELSIARGNRLYHANCSPCHGRHIDGKVVPGVVGQYLPGPDLTMEAYRPDKDPTKTDGHFFKFIHFGGMAIMPAYGSKFSISEHWDMVNYLRQMQGGK